MKSPQKKIDTTRRQEIVALVALGANLSSLAGGPAATLCEALHRLGAAGLPARRISRFWCTPAHPPGSGPDYVNAAAMLETGGRDAGAVLATLHGVEAALGRVRDGGRWQARGIDLDLLALGDTVLPDAAGQDRWRSLPPDRQARETPGMLILPHPRLQDRGFVLAPLAEIAPGWVHPRLGLTVAAMLAALHRDALAGMAPLDGGARA